MVDSSTTYTSASGRWRRSGFVIIVSVHDTSIASFPIRFLQSSGDNTWSYVLHVVNLLIEVDSRYPGDIVDDHGNPVDPQDAPAAGVFRYIEQGKSSDVKLAKGPEYFNHNVAPSGLEESTRSASSVVSRSRPDQLAFREELLARDGWCLLTNNLDPSGSDAAHVVPQSRPDVYQQLIGDSFGMFDVSAGILLDKTYHKAYDALKWSLYLKDDTFYVHYFNPTNDAQRAMNGLTLPPSRFRVLDKPDPVLVAWHYTQAVRMRIRGYSVGDHSDFSSERIASSNVASEASEADEVVAGTGESD